MYLDWKKKDCFVIDIEADSLDPTVIWVMCWKNARTGETGECRSHEDINAFFRDHTGSVYVGHNILKFDAPVLVRLLNVQLSVGNCIDTLVLSTLYSPSINGGHSLDAWGGRLGKAKGDFHDWSHLSEEMVTYCHQDVAITYELFRRLISTLERIGFTEQSIWIQHHFTALLEQQRINGFYFDYERGVKFYNLLRDREQELAEDVHRVFPPTLECLATYKKAFRKDGSFNKQYVQHSDIYERIDLRDDGSYDVYGRVPFNIGSPGQRVAKLVELGWEPEEFTDAGNPKPFDKGKLSPSLERFLEETPTPEVHLIAKWMSVNGRGNMVNTWLENWNESDSCIHGKLFVADTLRLRHQAPNTANIPAVRVDKVRGILYGDEGYYTYEARDLWTARPGRVLVGTDASGLELRMLAHYLNRDEFTRSVVDGDPHQYNADVVGITRPQAKTLIYAIMYGAGPPKIAKTLGVPLAEGKRIRELFLEKLGIKELMDQAKAEQKQGRIELVDGSWVVCHSPHAALNYKLQGGGARVMALSACLADREVRRHGWDALKVGDIHDEDQTDCHPDIAHDFGAMRCLSITKAGALLKMNVPLAGEYKVGLTWAQTH